MKDDLWGRETRYSFHNSRKVYHDIRFGDII